MRCASVSTLYAYGTPSGSGGLVAADVVTAGPDASACLPGQFVVLTMAEFDQYTASPFRLTLEEGGAIAGAVLLVWSVAWAFRQVIHVLRHTDTPPSHD